jgi:hypothetical protein
MASIVSTTELVNKKWNRRPKTKGYHPNASPFKVIVHPIMGDSYIKREYTIKNKAEKYAMELSLKKPKWKITIQYIKI